MINAVSALSALGRLLIAAIFVRAGINKIGSIAATAVTMAGHGIPYPDILVWGAIVVEIGGGLFLVFGLFTRWAALFGRAGEAGTTLVHVGLSEERRGLGKESVP
jgi:uncharacterized membrane protein YphA (DoxX/SURF4 family)